MEREGEKKGKERKIKLLTNEGTKQYSFNHKLRDSTASNYIPINSSISMWVVVPSFLQGR